MTRRARRSRGATVISPREGTLTATVIRPSHGSARPAPVTVKRPRPNSDLPPGFTKLLPASAQSVLPSLRGDRREPEKGYRETTQAGGSGDEYRETSQPDPGFRPRQVPVSDPGEYRELTQESRRIRVIRPRKRGGKWLPLYAIRARNFRRNKKGTQKSPRTFSFEGRGGEGW